MSRLSQSLLSLRQQATAAISAANELRLQATAAGLEVSQNGGPWRVLQSVLGGINMPTGQYLTGGGANLVGTDGTTTPVNIFIGTTSNNFSGALFVRTPSNREVRVEVGTPKFIVGANALQTFVPISLRRYEVADLPTGATVASGSLAYCNDDVGGQVPAFYDGTNWRRVTDRAICSTG